MSTSEALAWIGVTIMAINMILLQRRVGRLEERERWSDLAAARLMRQRLTE